ncbi:MAG: S49 family peptidase [Rhodovulum sulfidophilum]|uniref:S49 family peptidase n=1 Tax=Rhodovulum sulfidophilum TaxID=35806 RepID=A0A2W5QE43_RHOSU|nr:MAG: S49 family peptidase [Rhodovulum sulfidophilum]
MIEAITRQAQRLRNRITRRRAVIPVIRLEGVIGGGGRLGGGGLTDAGLAPLIEAAFSRGEPRAVALSINSPGGSPAQSSLIAARIRRLADEKKIPVHAFVEDVAASGGYWLATAADEIHVDRSSILGSIGVISASFGFAELIARHGIERRVHTSGVDKSMLDPFRPEKPEDVARLESLQAVIHGHFIDQVRGRRGGRLTGEDLFTGEFWLGERAIELGLADSIGHLVPTMRARYGEKVRFVPVAPRRPLLRRLGLPGASEAVAEAVGRIEDHAHWARFGVKAP